MRSAFPLGAAFILMMAVILSGPSRKAPPAQPRRQGAGSTGKGPAARPGRLVISVVDAMRLEMMNEP